MYQDSAIHPVLPLFQDAGGISPVVVWIIVILLIILIFWLLWRERGRRSDADMRETAARESAERENARETTAREATAREAAAREAAEEEALARRIESVEADVAQPAVIPNPATRAGALDEIFAETSVAPAVDDLEIIEGIGPKIAGLLKAAGVTSFAQLADMEPASIREILQAANLRLADPGSWPEQARLAANGDMTGLQALQDRLKGGR